MAAEKIKIGREKLLKDSMDTTLAYLVESRVQVDHVFGAGYAEKHPELVAALVQAMAIEYGSGSIAIALEASADTIKSGIDGLSIAVEDK